MSFMDLFKIKKFKKEISELKDKLETSSDVHKEELQVLIEEIHNLKKIISNYTKETNSNLIRIASEQIDINTFFTNTYKVQFESIMNNESHTKDELLDKFNKLINEETVYFEGIASCIDFIRTKRNPKKSTEKQLVKYILTESGRNSLDSYIKAITMKDSENNV